MHAETLARFNCKRCSADKGLKAVYGCDVGSKAKMPTELVDDSGETIRYKNCPIKFIPGSVWGFMKAYKYHKDFQGAPMPPFDQVSDRFLSAIAVYESAMADFRKQGQ